LPPQFLAAIATTRSKTLATIAMTTAASLAPEPVDSSSTSELVGGGISSISFVDLVTVARE